MTGLPFAQEYDSLSPGFKGNRLDDWKHWLIFVQGSSNWKFSVALREREGDSGLKPIGRSRRLLSKYLVAPSHPVP